MPLYIWIQLWPQQDRNANTFKHDVPCRRITRLEACQATLLVTRPYGPARHRPAGRPAVAAAVELGTVPASRFWATASLSYHIAPVVGFCRQIRTGIGNVWLSVRAKLIRRLHGHPSNRKSLTFSREGQDHRKDETVFVNRQMDG